MPIKVFPFTTIFDPNAKVLVKVPLRQTIWASPMEVNLLRPWQNKPLCFHLMALCRFGMPTTKANLCLVLSSDSLFIIGRKSLVMRHTFIHTHITTTLYEAAQMPQQQKINVNKNIILTFSHRQNG